MSARSVVDYALQRRAVLAGLASGRVSRSDVCDADPLLVRASRWHGEETARPCPVCAREPLRSVSWVYGDALGPVSGSARRRVELEEMDREFTAFRVFDVEVCRACRWNYTTASYVLGSGTRALTPSGRERRPRETVTGPTRTGDTPRRGTRDL